MKDPPGKMHMCAAASTTINRTEFGITGSQGMVGNDIAIAIDVELVKASGEAK